MTGEKEINIARFNLVFVEAREAKGLTLDSVSSQLNLSVEQLKKIESDNFNPSELTLFERGYVRNYAALLGIDSSNIETFFPDVESVATVIHSVQRCSYPVNTPLLGKALTKWSLVITVFAVSVFMIVSVLSGQSS